jgi:hypothetical protein
MFAGGRRLIVCNVGLDAKAGDFSLPPNVWYILGSTASSICNISLAGPQIDAVTAAEMADALEGADLEWCVSLFAGLEQDQMLILAAKQWWKGDVGKKRFEGLLMFLRAGCFEVVIRDLFHFPKSNNFFEKGKSWVPSTPPLESQRTDSSRDSKMRETSIGSCGPASWLRYHIVRDGMFWTGTAWTPRLREARLFAHLPLVMVQWISLSDDKN